MKLHKEIFNALHVLVIGDLMIDQYMWGDVKRRSPEADIPVLEQVTIERKLGGAANVALNIKQLGAKATLMGAIGKDDAGRRMHDLLQKVQINSLLCKAETRQTTVKTRIYKGNKQILRVDQEDKSALSLDVENDLLHRLEKIIEADKPDIVILQDYNKGVLNSSTIPKILEIARANNIFVAVDPKVENFTSYKNVDLFKPNYKELHYKELNNLPPFQVETTKVEATKLQNEIAAKTILVTLSEHGAMLLTENMSYYRTAERIDIVDVCGAGDTVIAITSMCTYLKFSPESILEICNQAGKTVCQQTGVVAISIDDLL